MGNEKARHWRALLWAGAPERTRTSDARFRKPTLYPLSYGGKKDADIAALLSYHTVYVRCRGARAGDRNPSESSAKEHVVGSALYAPGADT